jgi:hypothetical protein|tara:strand:- start:237 stop:509 length:273 start_codon:yes stop_codon:yes gene_type:complete
MTDCPYTRLTFLFFNQVNYFGKHVLEGGGAGNIKLKPVLMQKGKTRLALYGLGYIRDARLHQMFSVKGNVEWCGAFPITTHRLRRLPIRD